MGSINYVNPNLDQTVRIYDQFYSYDVNVPMMEYDSVYSYMASIFGTKDAAANFTVTMFQIAQSSGIPVMTLLQQIQGLTNTQLTLTLAYYLNNIRSSTTLLGINAPVTPNYYAARNIRS